MEDLTGTILLEKYRIDGLLGQGGMGSVFRGEHVGTGRTVAVKLLDERFLGNASVVQRFGREARAASAIQHPGIVEVLDLDQTKDGVPFLVMELLPGYSLSTRIETKTRLGLEETMDVMAQLLEALDAAHDHGVIHRDLKPDNIILIPRKRRSQLVKILDFGISQKSDERVANLTVAGTVLGTPHYMAPEQALGDSDIDVRADLYAAGIVMYECLTGDVPFDADNYNALIFVILNETPSPPSDRGAEIGPNLEKALLQCLSRDKEQRPNSATEMLQLLRDARNRDELAPPPRPSGSKPSLASIREAVTEPPGVGAAPIREAVTEPPSPKAAPVAAPASGNGAPKPAAVDMDSSSFATSDLVIAPTSRHSRKSKAVVPKAPPPDPDDDFDPFMETGQAEGDLQLDESVLAQPRGSLRPSLKPNRGEASPVPSRAPGAVSHRPAPVVNTSHRPPPPKKSRAVFYALGVLLFLAGGIVAARFLVGGPDEIPVDPTPIGDPVEVIGETDPEPTQGGRVAIDVTGLPPGASVRLDGLPAGTFPLRLRRGSTHVLEVSAPGYESREIRFTADDDKRLRGNLRPATGAVP